MKTEHHPSRPVRPSAPLGLLLAVVALSLTAAAPVVAPLLIDDYSDPTRNRSGLERLLIDDKMVGSGSKATQRCTNGVLFVQGNLVPGRGVPAFISQASLLAAEGKPRDLTGHQGVRLRVKVIQGLLCVQVASASVTNFDYHAGPPIAGKRGDFQEVKVPFKDMKRSWSEQTPLDLKSLTSVNLISFGMAKDAFAYEVDELGFY
jgi:hypothetical protein